MRRQRRKPLVPGIDALEPRLLLHGGTAGLPSAEALAIGSKWLLPAVFWHPAATPGAGGHQARHHEVSKSLARHERGHHDGQARHGRHPHDGQATKAGAVSTAVPGALGRTVQAATTATIEAIDDNYRILHDQPFAISTYGDGDSILYNDKYSARYTGGNRLTAVLVGAVSAGTLSLNDDGSFSYVPPPNWVGTATFRYYATNGTVNSINVATVTLTVYDNAPVASDAKTEVVHGGSVLLTFENDFTWYDVDYPDRPVYSTVAAPAHGTVSVDTGGNVRYNSNVNFVGTDYFTYRVWDRAMYSNTATVKITVTDTPPTAVDESYTVWSNNTLTVPAQTGVVVPNRDAAHPNLTAIQDEAPTQGTLSLASNGSFVYTPTAGYFGPDSFTYHTFDGFLNSVIALVMLDVKDSRPTIAYTPGLGGPSSIGPFVDVIGDVASASVSPPVGSGKTLGSVTWTITPNEALSSQAPATKTKPYVNRPLTPGGVASELSWYWDQNGGDRTVTARVTYADGSTAPAVSLTVRVVVPSGRIAVTRLGTPGLGTDSSGLGWYLDDYRYFKIHQISQGGLG